MKKYKLIKTLAIATPVTITPLLAASCNKQRTYKATVADQKYALKQLNAAAKKELDSSAFRKIVTDTSKKYSSTGAFQTDVSKTIEKIYNDAINAAEKDSQKPKGFNIQTIAISKLTFDQNKAVFITKDNQRPGVQGAWTLTANPALASETELSNAQLSYNLAVGKQSINNQIINFQTKPGFRYFPLNNLPGIGAIEDISTSVGENVIAIATKTDIVVGVLNKKTNKYAYQIFTSEAFNNYWSAIHITKNGHIIAGSKEGAIAIGTANSNNVYSFKFQYLHGITQGNSNYVVTDIKEDVNQTNNIWFCASWAGLFQYKIENNQLVLETSYDDNTFPGERGKAKAVVSVTKSIDNGKYLYVGTAGIIDKNWRPDGIYPSGGVYVLDTQTKKVTLLDWKSQPGGEDVNYKQRIISLHVDANNDLMAGFTNYKITGTTTSDYSSRGIMFGYYEGDGTSMPTASSFKWTNNKLDSQGAATTTYAINSFTDASGATKIIMTTQATSSIQIATVDKAKKTIDNFIVYGQTGENGILAQTGGRNLYSISIYKQNNNVYIYISDTNGFYLSRTYN